MCCGIAARSTKSHESTRSWMLHNLADTTIGRCGHQHTCDQANRIAPTEQARALQARRLSGWFITYREEITRTFVGTQHSPHFLKCKGPRAAPAEDRHLITAFIDRAVAIERFRNRQRLAFCLEGCDQLRLWPRTEAGVG